MSNKPTHTAYVVIDPREGSDRKAQWDRSFLGAVCTAAHKSGKELRPGDPRRDQPLRPHRLPRAQGAAGRIGLRPRRTVRRGSPIKHRKFQSNDPTLSPSKRSSPIHLR